MTGFVKTIQEMKFDLLKLMIVSCEAKKKQAVCNE